MDYFSSKGRSIPHLEVQVLAIEMGVFLNELNPGQEGLPNTFKNLFSANS